MKGRGKSSHLIRYVPISTHTPKYPLLKHDAERMWGCSVSFPTAWLYSCHSPSSFHFGLSISDNSEINSSEVGTQCVTLRTIRRNISYPLLAAINPMTECESVLCRFPSVPLDNHLPERLCLYHRVDIVSYIYLHSRIMGASFP